MEDEGKVSGLGKNPGLVLHFGGNGHAAVRLEAARAALDGRPGAPMLVDVPYPGFEGRPRATSRDGFLDVIAEFAQAQRESAVASYASGIGALIALSLRAHGALQGPLILQGPVLWRLKRRLFPGVMRLTLARQLLRHAFTIPAFQRRFVRRFFQVSPEDAVVYRFFRGYAECASFGDLFRWFTPDWLDALEADLKARPQALRDITIWCGGRDRVVGREEVTITERVLGCRWPVVEFATWGHYPMIDVPREWAEALVHALETTR